MKKILIVDDEVEVLNVLERILERLGCHPVTTDSWETALEKFDNETFDLVVLDVHMPGRDGFQVAKDIKDKNPNQKIVIMTGLDAGEVFKKFRAVGVDVNEIIYKPFTVDKIRLMVSKVLG